MHFDQNTITIILAVMGIVFAPTGIASFIVKLTPTEADNKVVDFIIDVLHKLALNPNKDDARMP